MMCPIETNRESDGRWIVSVPALPGLQVFGYSEEEALSTARRLNALLGQPDLSKEEGNFKILVFYPNRTPAAESSSVS